VGAGGVVTGSSDAQARVVGQLVTGVGFLGGGVILTREGLVVGVTSAAVIWILAGIGVMIGLERYTAAALLSLLTVGILVGMNLIEKFFAAFSRGMHGRKARKKKCAEDGE
jgi:putative Mg2+ transporter-C (MgtC) family protein